MGILKVVWKQPLPSELPLETPSFSCLFPPFFFWELHTKCVRVQEIFLRIKHQRKDEQF